MVRWRARRESGVSGLVSFRALCASICVSLVATVAPVLASPSGAAPVLSEGTTRATDAAERPDTVSAMVTARVSGKRVEDSESFGTWPTTS
jgi:hypothetical protein